MELRDFCERVLFGERLADKLQPPGELSDERPGTAIGEVPLPGRPPGMQLVARPGARLAFPSAHALDAAEARGRALHFFANHELMALELMALAGLRFVDAPADFRRTVMATLVDEQRHLALYLERMRALGVEFGELPLGGTFWSGLSAMASPLEYVAKHSLVFEQANLDFAVYYRELFATVGDADSAAVMQRIHEDEVHHVRVGLQWFERLTGLATAAGAAEDRGEVLFAAHGRALDLSVSLARARGPVFDREGRRRAGLPDGYVAALARLQAPKIRPPHLFVFLDEREDGDDEHDLALLPAFLASAEDVAVVGEEPDPDLLARLAAAGLTLPRLVRASAGALSAREIGHPRVGRVEPWRWGEHAHQRLRTMLAELDDGGFVDRSFAVHEAARALLPDAAESVLERVLAPENAAVGAGEGGARVADREEPWLVDPRESEGEGESLCTIHYACRIDRRGQAVGGHGARVELDAAGAVVAGALGALVPALPTELRRFAHGDGRAPHRLERRLARAASEWATRLRAVGYAGPLVIGAAIVRDDGGGLRCRVDLTPELGWGVGHVLGVWSRALARGAAGVWRRLTWPGGEADGLARERLARLGQAVHLEHDRGSHPRLRRALVFTNDPQRARRSVGALIVGEDALVREEFERAFARAGASDRSWRHGS